MSRRKCLNSEWVELWRKFLESWVELEFFGKVHKRRKWNFQKRTKFWKIYVMKFLLYSTKNCNSRLVWKFNNITNKNHENIFYDAKFTLANSEATLRVHIFNSINFVANKLNWTNQELVQFHEFSVLLNQTHLTWLSFWFILFQYHKHSLWILNPPLNHICSCFQINSSLQSFFEIRKIQKWLENPKIFCVRKSKDPSKINCSKVAEKPKSSTFLLIVFVLPSPTIPVLFC